jgi:putative flippase GtrA
MTEKTTPKESTLSLIYRIMIYPVSAALAGMGMYWWWSQPFVIQVPEAVSIAIGCYVAAIVGYTTSEMIREK